MDPNAIIKIKNTVQILTTMLMEILRNPGTRGESVANFQKEVWNVDAPADDFPELRILRDLALRLDYYQPDPRKCQEDKSYYGDERLEAEIRAAIRQLTEPNTA